METVAKENPGSSTFTSTKRNAENTPMSARKALGKLNIGGASSRKTRLTPVVEKATPTPLSKISKELRLEQPQHDARKSTRNQASAKEKEFKVERPAVVTTDPEPAPTVAASEEEWPEIEHYDVCTDPKTGCLDCFPDKYYSPWFEPISFTILEVEDESADETQCRETRPGIVPAALEPIPEPPIPVMLANIECLRI